MIRKRLVRILVGLTLLGGTSLSGCGARTEDHATDTKTNWLATCGGNEDCDDGLSCVCGVCTIGCATSDACDTFGGEAACFHAECAHDEGVCALPDTRLESTVVLPDGGSMQNCSHPSHTYAALGQECEGLTIDCFEQSHHFEDECGCGCDPGPSCDPELFYLAYGDRCETIDYDCSAGEEHFTDECGCGCKASELEPECPREDDAYLLLGNLCDAAAVDCTPGFEYFRDECGCGCEPSEVPPECPRESNAYALLGEQCDQPNFVCTPMSEYFRDDCGCGCESPETDAECPRESDAYLSLADECDAAEIDCAIESMYFRDDCGCGCEPNPACDPEVDYVASAGSCTLAEISCQESELVVTDECGCGCRSPGGDVDGGSVNEGSVDAGSATDACLAPEGNDLDTTLLFQTTCLEFANVHRVVGTQEEFEQAMVECGAQAVFEPGFSGTPLYITTVPDRVEARHVYTVETDAGLQLGMEYTAYCGGARPPTLLFVFEVEDLTVESTITEDVCMSGECSGPPPP